MTFIKTASPLERLRKTVMINLGNESHFSAGHTAVVSVCMCVSLETALLGIHMKLYDNLNSPQTLKRHTNTHAIPI